MPPAGDGQWIGEREELAQPANGKPVPGIDGGDHHHAVRPEEEQL